MKKSDDRYCRVCNCSIRKLDKDVLGIKYKLTVCDGCMSEKFHEFKLKKRVYNTLNKMTSYAFNVPDSVVYEYGKTRAVTLTNLIMKYGKEDGEKRFEAYKLKQAKSNTFDYKKEKHGWNEIEFKDYNNSRAVTLNNLIRRHGEEQGKALFDSYKAKQSTNGCKLEWFISKYGEIEGTIKYKAINKQKAITLQNFIRKYGEDLGTSKFFDLQKNRFVASYSKVSQKLFEQIENHITQYGFKTYFATKNKEFGLQLYDRFVFLDYYIHELKLAIEFFGNIYHGNPKKFKPNDKPNIFMPNLSASDMWERDADRIRRIKDIRDIDVIIVWEDDYQTKPVETLKTILNEISNRIDKIRRKA